MSEGDPLIIELSPPFVHRGGFAWTAAVESLPHAEADRAALVLREAGRGLGPGAAMEADIRSHGGGRYAVWPASVCFSTSDNSDPNANGRDYALTVAAVPATRPTVSVDVATPPWRAPEEPLRVGVAGFGARGVSFVRRLGELDGVEVAWIADPSLARLETAQGLATRLTASTVDMFADPSIDAVFIAVPDWLHREAAESAFSAGKHVFLEKPIATTLADARAVLSAWRASGKVLQLGYVLRETPFYKAVRKVVREGRLGRIHSLELTDHLGLEHGASYMRRWHRHSERSGGLMIHKGCHDLDLICWILDEAPLAVSSFGANLAFSREPPAPYCSQCGERIVCPFEDRGLYEERSPAERADPTAFGLDVCVFGGDKDIVDGQVVAFEMSGGTRGVFSLAMHNPSGSTRSINIMGDAGRLSGDFHGGRFKAVFSGTGAPMEWEARNLPASGHGGGDARAVASFLSACIGRAAPELTDPADAVRGLTFAVAAERARLSGRVVRLDEEMADSAK